MRTQLVAEAIGVVWINNMVLKKRSTVLAQIGRYNKYSIIPTAHVHRQQTLRTLAAT